MLEKKLEEYAEMFEENFPIFFFRHVPEDEIIKMIDGCLENGTPYTMEDDGEADI